MQAEQSCSVTELMHKGEKLKPYFVCVSFVYVATEPSERDAATVFISSDAAPLVWRHPRLTSQSGFD